MTPTRLPPGGSSLSRRRQRKAVVRGHLERREIDALREWARREGAAVVGTLVALALELDDLLRWRAVEALALIAADQAARDLERVRELIRRQLWSMTDESGNVPWHAPELIGEVLFRVPALAPEYLSQLASHGEDPFCGGVAWALARLARAQPGLVGEQLEWLRRGLGHPDPLVRGNAALALGRLGRVAEAREALETLGDDEALVLRYDFTSGRLARTSVGAQVRAALAAAGG